MVMIFSWDPSSKIIFLHVALGEGRGGGGGVCVFQISSELRLCQEMTAKSYSDFLNHITNYFLAICEEPKRVLLSLQFISAL